LVVRYPVKHFLVQGAYCIDHPAMVDTVEAQALRYAARLAGSNERLAMQLQVSVATLDRWLGGEEAMPDDKLLALLSLLLDAMGSREA